MGLDGFIRGGIFMKKIVLLFMVLALSVMVIACAKQDESTKEINVGYFPNISHAPAMVGVEKGIFEDTLNGVTVNIKNFPNGSLFMDALATKQIDIGYVGPGPVINRYLQGGEVVVIANASKGENVLVVRKDVKFDNIKDLEGKVVATPSTGCTHDLILRKMLQEQGIAVEENGGKVKRIAQKPAAMMGLFEQKQIDAAVVSEPWASLMEAQGMVSVVREAREVPWDGNLPATVLVVRKDFLQANPELVEQFIQAHEKSIDFINQNKKETIKIIAKQIKTITQQEIEKDIIENALNRVQYTSSIDQDILQEFANLSKELGFIKDNADLQNLFWDKIGR
ncbi:MAG: sulfonate transport system substrate-binding protein [Clostridiales bacterium]|jgi:NitT/TauT family transport system substrate-binding protein|nr:sulfonate transport system substrate-binding protein [Clostridiales bacterium]